MKRRPVEALSLLLASLAVLLCAATTAHAFACLHINNGRCVRWSQGGATLRSFLGNDGTVFFNGTLSWDQNAINAANDWNALGAAFRFDVTVGGQFIDPCGAQGSGHACHNTGPVGDNPVFFATNFCGQGFGDIIELTNNCADRTSGALLNAPVWVNDTVEWNAYDGPLRAVNNRVIHDIRRVLVHEFGHVLGLDHPDDNDQNVVAIMNSRESNVDRLRQDDIDGLFSLYPNAGPAGTSSGCQMTPNGVVHSGWIWLLPAPLAILRRPRRSPGRTSTLPTATRCGERRDACRTCSSRSRS